MVVRAYCIALKLISYLMFVEHFGLQTPSRAVQLKQIWDCTDKRLSIQHTEWWSCRTCWFCVYSSQTMSAKWRIRGVLIEPPELFQWKTSFWNLCRCYTPKPPMISSPNLVHLTFPDRPLHSCCRCDAFIHFSYPFNHRSGQMRIDPTLFSFPTWDGIGVCTRYTVIWQCMRCWGILIMFTMVRKGFSTLASQKEFSNLTFISIWDLANPPVTWPMD